MSLPTKFLLLIIMSNIAGASFSPEIVDGIEAKPLDLVSKSTIAIQMPSTENGQTYYSHCTSFVIAPDLLMTAAHCLAFLTDKSPVQAILSLEPKYGLDDGTQIRIGLKDYRIHPQYYGDDSGVYNDVAIIKLQRQLPPEYVPLSFVWGLDSLISPKQNLIVAGFGVTTDYGQPDALPAALRFTNVPFIGGNKGEVAISDQLLVDQSRSGFCNGDSGGPLYVSIGLQLVPIGIVSHVTQNAQGQWSCKSEGAFTRIAYFIDWVVPTISELSVN